MKFIGMVALCVLSVALSAQGNLVPNGSFEEYTTCPDYFSQWSRVVYWSSPYTQSSDYFNGCADGLICSVPLNQFGYQAPADGQAYMGLATYGQGDPTYREVIATELLAPLVIGVPVCVSFKAACGGYGSSQDNSAAWKARGPGLRFFTELPTDWGALLYPNDAVVHMDTVLGDTAEWVDISGTFVPDSAYRFLAITNFYADSLSWPQPLVDGGGFPCAYAFVDDVRVSISLSYCSQQTGIADLVYDTQYFAESEAGGSVLLRTGGPARRSRQIIVVTATGQVIWQGQWSAGEEVLRVRPPSLASGLFLIRIQEADGGTTTLRHVHGSP